MAKEITHPRFINGKYVCKVCTYSTKYLEDHCGHFLDRPRCLKEATIGDRRWLRNKKLLIEYISADWVAVYHDPITMTKLEGEGQLVTKLSEEGDLEMWKMVMKMKMVEREIKKLKCRR